VRLLVTNDDGIDAPGIAYLVQAMETIGEVVVVAPDREFSGASQSVGSLMHTTPSIRKRRFPGADHAWAVSGPPALCVLYANLGLFGQAPDLVVSGINPGANIGRSVYHSGTLGACLSARNCGWSGVAISQAAPVGAAADGQAFVETRALQKWEVAAEVAHAYVAALVNDLPDDPVVVNLNVPNEELGDIVGWRVTDVSPHPAGIMSDPVLVPRDDDPEAFDVNVAWTRARDEPDTTDTGAVRAGYVSISYISRLTHEARPDVAGAEGALAGLLGARR